MYAILLISTRQIAYFRFLFQLKDANLGFTIKMNRIHAFISIRNGKLRSQ